MADREATIRERLDAIGQAHVLRFLDELPADRRQSLLDDVEAVDLGVVDRLVATHVRDGAPPAVVPADLEPCPAYPWVDPAAVDESAAEQRAAGTTLVQAGKVAAFTVAGGQGTRLGWNGPKGTYPATPVTGKPLFRVFAEQILAASTRHGVEIPWYIMTSLENDADTRAFFLDNNCFGLPRTSVFMFPQGMLPAVDAKTGRLLLAEKHALALSPDGHGGSLAALRRSGALEDMRSRGIELISYFQVDNPLVRVIDPRFLGLHATAPESSGEMSSKMVRKTDPEERVGVFVRTGGVTRVIEYSDLPADRAQARDADGTLRFDAGSIAVHVMSVEFVERLTLPTSSVALPHHAARKAVPHIDPETGDRVVPDRRNAVKFETFVFDALPFARASIVLETTRAEEFAPIKNAAGDDSPVTSHRLQSDRAATWLEAHGVIVARDAEGHADARIEISPLAALEPADLVGVDLPQVIEAGEEVVL